MRAHRPLAVALACAALSGTPACGRVSRARECLALADTVNARLATIEAEFSRGPRDAPAYEAAAAAYGELAVVVRAHPISAPNVRRAADEYAAHADRCAKAATQVSQALGAPPEAKAAEAKAEVDRLLRAERAAVGKLEQACR